MYLKAIRLAGIVSQAEVKLAAGKLLLSSSGLMVWCLMVRSKLSSTWRNGEVRPEVFIMIDFSKKLRRIVCILAGWDVLLRFTRPSRDTSLRLMEIIDNVGTRQVARDELLGQTLFHFRIIQRRGMPGSPLSGVSWIVVCQSVLENLTWLILIFCSENWKTDSDRVRFW